MSCLFHFSDAALTVCPPAEAIKFNALRISCLSTCSQQLLADKRSSNIVWHNIAVLLLRNAAAYKYGTAILTLNSFFRLILFCQRY